MARGFVSPLIFLEACWRAVSPNYTCSSLKPCWHFPNGSLCLLGSPEEKERRAINWPDIHKCVCVNDTIKEALLLSVSHSALRPEVKCCQSHGQACIHFAFPEIKTTNWVTVSVRKLAMGAGTERGRVDVVSRKGVMYCSWSFKQLCWLEGLYFSPFAFAFQSVGLRDYLIFHKQ